MTTAGDSGSDAMPAMAAMVRWLLETTHQGLFVTDNSLRVLAWNRWMQVHTGWPAPDVAGRPLFEVFPDNPADAESNGVANLYASLRTAAQTCRPHEMSVQRYDIRDGESRFVERYWRPVNTPMLDDDGMVVALLHHVEDVTEAVLSPSAAGSPAIRASS